MEMTAPRQHRSTSRRRLKLLGLFLGVLVGGFAALAGVALALGPPEGTLRYEWKIADRYGLDANGDGIVDNHDGMTDLAGDKAYIQNPTYTLTFDTCASPAVTERSSVITGYVLTLSGPEAKTVNSGSCKITATVAKLGTFTAKVEIKVGPTTVDSRTETITPKDNLVVSVGDSVASGEGNPDILEPGLGFTPTWQNRQCHRSGLAGPAQAALRMERRDPHTAITFVHVACSGASITEGILGDYEGIERKEGDPVLKPQLDQVRDLVGPRAIDALTVSIGANDAKFSNVVKACLVMANCHTDHIDGLPNAKDLFDKEIPNLEKNYPMLDARLDKMAKQAAGEAKLTGKVFITQYFDVTKADDGGYCTGLTQKEIEAGRDVNGQTTDGLKQNEMEWASSYVQDGMNNRVKAQIDAANATSPTDGSKWVWVDGINPKFGTHGYCAVDRWIRTLTESFLYQGNPDGPFHPNAEGHLYGYATSIEDEVAPALGIGGTPLPLESAGAEAVGDALSSWVGTLDRTGALDSISSALPFGARDEVQTWIRDKFFGKFLPWVQDKIAVAGNTVTEISERLDDLDGDGNPGVDAFGIANLDLDISGDIQPKAPSKTYDITFRLKGSVAMDPDLALKAGEIGLTGQKADGTVRFDQTVKLHVDLTKPLGDQLRLTLPEDGLSGEIEVDLAADFGGTDGAANGPDRPPLTFTAGILGLKAVGPAQASFTLGYDIADPNGDGRIDATEIGNPLEWVRARCESGATNVDLDVSASLTGFTSKLGNISLVDPNLCDGIEPPTVDLAELGQFQGVTPIELVNGLAQLTTTLKGIQAGHDIDIPFVKEGLAGLISANERLVKFFVDNGLTDPANPMANVTFDPTKRPDLDTLDELLPKLATALGVPVGNLNPRVVDQRLLLDLSVAADPAPIVGAGTLDFGDQLSRAGLVEVTGTAKATIDPAVALNIGVGVDLRPGLELGDRFFVQTADGPELSLDAKVTADAALSAKLAILGVGLADDNPTGPVTLLDRKDPTKPLLGIDLVDTSAAPDGRLTLTEITTPTTTAKSPIKVTINGKVPTFGLDATAKLAGAPFAQGKVTIGWPDITVPTGLSVTLDGGFANTLLPFAFDPENPRAAITQILTAAHAGVSGLRGVLASDPELVKALPLAGKSAADLDPMLAKAEARLAQLIDLSENLTLEQVEAEVEKALGEALDIANAQWPGLVAFRFEPQTDTRNAALVAELTLGICTTDRAGQAGCSNTEPKLSLPLNLALGTGADSVAAVSSTGEVSVSYDARLKLAVGLELPRITPGTTPGSSPTVSGSPKTFVLDSSSFELGVAGAVSGTLDAVLGPVEVQLGTTARPAQAAVAARYRLRSATADPANPQRIYAGNLPGWLTTIDPDPSTSGGLHDSTYPAACTPAADACAVFPTTINGAFAGDITFSAPDLLSPAGWTFDASAVLSSLSSESFQFAVLLDGISAFTQRLENSLRSMPAGTKIPLLGTDPTAGADVLADFRTGVVEPFQELVNTLNASNNVTAVQNAIQTFFYDKIGPTSSVSLLRDGADAGTDITKADVEVIAKCKVSGVVGACTGSAAATSIEDLQIKLPLAKTASATTEPFDSGFPGLRLSSDEGISASVGFELDLAFGVDRTNGFYIPVNAFGSQPELRVQATASLPNQINGEIAFVPVQVNDLRAGQPDVAASLGVNLAAGGSDGKVTLGQLGSAEIVPSVSACANVQLGLVTGGSKKFPQFKADLKMTGGISCAAGGVTGAPAASSFGITFDNVRVNAGSVINDFITPAVQTVRKYTGPLEPTIDALRKPIPGIAEAARAAGRPAPTWWDLMNAINDIRMNAGEADQLALLKRVIFVSDLARNLDTSSGSFGDISLGSFNLSVTKASQEASAASIDGLISSFSEAGGSTPILDRLAAAGVDVQLADQLKPITPYNSLTFPAFQRPQRLFELLLGKDVPLVRFEAGGSFLHVPIGPYSFPVGPATVYFGGALDLSGHFAAGFDTYGIRQAYAMLTDDDPTNDSFGQAAAGLLGGFYLDDYDANGKDVPELLARAQVTVGAGVGIPGFGVFAEGGVRGTATIDLKTTDGKMRPQQIITQLRKNPNPVCLFDASARIDAFVRVVVSNPIKDIEFPIADAVILDEPDLTDFCNTQQSDAQPKLTGNLYADGTLELFASADSDRILVTQRAAGVVDVSSKGVVERFEGVSKVFVDGGAGNDQITLTTDLPRPGTISVYACGGPGKDGISADMGPATLYGDFGPASSTTENGVAKPLPCTSGPGAADTLTGGPDADKLNGGDGNDALIAKDGNDTLKGDAGDDVLQPGAGDDAVDGGTGTNDSYSAADRSDAGITIDLRPGATTGATGTPEADALAGIETAVGGPREDVLFAPAAGTVLDGGYGDDTLHGGIGADLLVGSYGDDVLLGGDGLDLLIGSGGNDRMVGGDGPDIHRGGDGIDTSDWSDEPGPVFITVDGQADDGAFDDPIKDNVADAEIVLGTPGADDLRAGTLPAELHGGDGDDTLTGPGKHYGEAGDDLLRGADGDDVLSGGPGQDDLLGKGGHDSIDGGTDDDHIDGGFGADLMVGGAGFDTVDYSSRTGDVRVRLTDGARDGENPNNTADGPSPDCKALVCDEVKPDIERIVGGSGDDTLDGDLFDQVLVGGPGDDVLHGHAGIDRFEGGPGKDDARDDDYQYSKPDAPGTGDTWIMGDGDDYVGGTGGDEHIELGDGNDKGGLNGTGQVFLDMGPGNDSFDTDEGDHTIIGGPGNDSLASYAGIKDIDMGDGDDYVGLSNGAWASRALLGPGKDSFSGATVGGPDVVDGGPGQDGINGGSGDDHIVDVHGANMINGGEGNDTIVTGPYSDEARGEGGNDTLIDQGNDGVARPGWPANQYLLGGSGDDVIAMTGTSAVDDTVTGDAGNDTLTGTAGPQTFTAGDGNDIVKGGPGNDRMNGGLGDDVLDGEDGDDIVNGGDGTNTLIGGLGADRLEGGANRDTVSYADRAAPVVVTVGSSGDNDGNALDTSTADPNQRDHVDFRVDHVIGTEGDDVIQVASMNFGEVADIEGRGGRDTLSAKEASRLQGGAGDDTLLGSPEVDTLEGGAGNDLLVGAGGADTEQGGDGNDRFDQGSAAEGGDAISGGPGTDVADYSARTTAITFTPGSGGADDGAAGEADDVDSTVESHRAPGAAGTTPTVALVAAETTAAVGERVTLTATVAGATGTPTGSVTITDNGTVLGYAPLDGTGKATFPARLLFTGTRNLVATYSGDARYRPAASPAAPVTVGKVDVTVSLAALNTPVPEGTKPKLRVTVTPVSGDLRPGGSVTITEGGVSLGSYSFTEGVGTFDLTAPLPLGVHQLVATWGGNLLANGATSAPVPVLVANGAAPAPAVAITTDPATPTALSPLALTATLTPVPGAPVPEGTVTFTAQGTDPVRPAVVLGEATVVDGAATLPLPAGLAGGSWTVQAAYSGSPATAPAGAGKALTVGRTATTTAVASSANPATVGDTFTLSATVTRASGAGVPTGKVTFLDGEVVLGSATLDGSGKATRTVGMLAGDHPVTARYEGSDVLAPSASTVLTQTVLTPTGTPAVPTTTTLARSGQQLTATVAAASGTVTGQVRFTLDGADLATVDLASGTASAPMPTLAPGAHTATATYLGSATHATSTSASLAFTAGSLPGAPGTPSVTATSAGSATITWPAPASDGGSPLTGYRITVKADAAGTTVATQATGTTRSATVTGLTPGRIYRFSVAATNAVGTGPDSALSAHALPPFRSLDAFTDRQFRDFANRAPSATELASWRTALANGSKTPAALVDSAVAFSYWSPKVDPITRLFSAYFLRLPDTGGLGYWVGEHRRGVSLGRISQFFAGSAEFKNRYGALTNRQFVELVYQNVLGRPGEAAGVAFWTKQLDSGKYTRGRVMVGFSESAEYKQKAKATTDVVAVVYGLLRRVPSADELAYWKARHAAGAVRTELIGAILALAEYDARV